MLHLSDEVKRGFSEPKKLVFEKFGVHRTHALQIFGGVHARRQVLVENQYADAVPVPEGSQLFQRLELFDGGWSKLRKRLQKACTVGIKSDVVIGGQIFGQHRLVATKCVTRPGKRRAREGKRSTLGVDFDLDYVRIEEVFGVGYRVRSGGNGAIVVLFKVFGNGAYDIDGNQRFVALNINDDRVVG